MRSGHGVIADEETSLEGDSERGKEDEASQYFQRHLSDSKRVEESKQVKVKLKNRIY